MCSVSVSFVPTPSGENHESQGSSRWLQLLNSSESQAARERRGMRPPNEDWRRAPFSGRDGGIIRPQLRRSPRWRSRRRPLVVSDVDSLRGAWTELRRRRLSRPANEWTLDWGAYS